MRRKKKKEGERGERMSQTLSSFFLFPFFFLASLDVNLPDVLNAKLYELSAII